MKFQNCLTLNEERLGKDKTIGKMNTPTKQKETRESCHENQWEGKKNND